MGWLFPLIVLTALGAAVTAAAEPEPLVLSAEERAGIVRRVEHCGTFRTAAIGRTDPRRYLTHFWAYELKAGKEAPRRLAEVTHFKYEGGETIRTTVDLGTREVVKVEVLKAYPTPLAPDELTAAVSLAKEKSPAVRAFYEKHPNDVQVQALAPVVADAKSPRFGHRIALLTFRTKKDARDSLLIDVDLTNRTIQAKSK